MLSFDAAGRDDADATSLIGKGGRIKVIRKGKRVVATELVPTRAGDKRSLLWQGLRNLFAESETGSVRMIAHWMKGDMRTESAAVSETATLQLWDIVDPGPTIGEDVLYIIAADRREKSFDLETLQSDRTTSGGNVTGRTMISHGPAPFNSCASRFWRCQQADRC